MRIKDIVLKANRNILLSKSRSILTILSIVVGATTLTFAIGAGFGVRDIVDRQLDTQQQDDVIQVFPRSQAFTDEGDSADVNQSVPAYQDEGEQESDLLERLNQSELFLSQEEVDDLSDRENVIEVYPEYTAEFLYAELRDQRFSPRYSVRYPSDDLELVVGEQDISDDQVIVTEEFAEQFEIDPQELVGEEFILAYPEIDDTENEVSTKTLTIAGVKATGFADGGAAVYTTYQVRKEVAQAQVSRPQTTFSQAVLELDPNLSDEDRESLRVSLEEDYVTFDSARDQDVASQVVTYLTIGMAGFAGIVLLASVFGVANTMLMSVFERTRQIGLMKALGISDGKVFLLFAVEGAMIGFWGAVGGILLAFGSSALIINPFLANFFAERNVEVPLQLVFPVIWLVAIVVLLMMISFLAAVLPARKAAKLSPISALRYE